jgi:hypothetical protein
MAKVLKPSEMAAVVGVIDPDAYTAATYTTGWISTSDFQSIMAVVMTGTLGASATVDAKLEQASDSSGTGAKDVTGAAITQLTKAGSDDDKQAIIECFAEDLDLVNAFTHVRLSLTVGTATSDAGAIVMGLAKRYAPASGGDLASVAEIVSA